MSEAAWPLIGHPAAEAAFLSAYDSGKLHHGWLIEGPSGIGKSILARRIAAFLLGAVGQDSDRLSAPASDPVVQKLFADAHPDLRWVARRPDDKGKVKQDIPVDDIRGLNHFFALKAALGGWRIGVIDSLDEMNRNGANAMLKTLEEPPANCLLILISHGTRPILPTIRSRCRTLRVGRLSDDETNSVLSATGADNIKAAASVARGRPGHGLKLASAAGLAAANATRTFLRALPKPSDAALSDAIRLSGADETAFEAFCGEVLAFVSDKAPSHPAYAKAWLDLSRLKSEAAALNMDRTQTAAKLVAGLQAAANSA